MVLGLVSAVVAGALVGVQNVFNSKVGEHVDAWATTAWVLGAGALASLALGLSLEGAAMLAPRAMEPWYWACGILGIGVVIGMVQSTRRLGPTLAISLVLASQLAFAVAWEALGGWGVTRVPLSWQQWLGVGVIIAGVLVFKGAAIAQQQRERRSPLMGHGQD